MLRLEERGTRVAASVPGLLPAALAAAAAAWLSLGSVGFEGPGGSRLAVLPLSFPALGIVLLAAAGVLALGRRGASLAPVALLALVFLPWLPVPLPPVFLMWNGRLTALIWSAVALGMIASLHPRFSVPLRPDVAAGALACAIYAVAAWQVSPSVPGGDEPHYLVITQSLLRDGDLKIENNHRRRDYREYHAGDLPPHTLRRGRDGEIYSVHAPGLPVLIAPAFAVGGYRAVMAFLVVVSALGSALAWRLSWLVTRRADAAWFGWAAVTLSATGIFHSFSVYPDGPGGVLTLTGIWALLRADGEVRNGDSRLRPWLLHGAALAALPWLHSRFAVLAGGIGALVLLRLAGTRNAVGKAVAFLSVPAIGALCWILFFVAIYGTPDPTAPYGSSQIGSLAYVPSGSGGILFDQRFGLLAYAPVLAFAFGGLVRMAIRPDRRRLAVQLLFIIVPYLVIVTNYAMWWGGWSPPARFFVPVLLPLAIPAAVAWTAIASRPARATASAALAFTVFASSVLVFAEGGRLAYNVRDSYALWLDWLNPAVDLARGVPAWFRGEEASFLRDVAIWAAALAAAFVALRAVERRAALRRRGVLAAAAAWLYATAAMAAVSLLWTLHGAEGITAPPAQLDLLRRIGAERVAAFALEPPRRLNTAAVAAMMRIEPPRASAPGGAGRSDRPLFSLPAVPAGRYRLRPRASGGEGWLMVGIGRDQFALRTEPLGAPPQPIVLDFPVDVRAIVVRGDEDARRAVRGLIVEPIEIVLPSRRVTREFARHAVQYPAATVFFLDDRSFPEAEAFWVAGAGSASIVLQPAAPRAAATLFLRNAPAANRVSIEARSWRDEFQLEAGEERRVQVPLDSERGATLIRLASSGGFRPSEVNPTSRDDRFLGVWVKPE
jgi:hypothetical protein